MVDYKLDGKKVTVAIPFKKVTEMKKVLKRIKKEKLHIYKKTGGGTFELTKDEKAIELTQLAPNGEFFFKSKYIDWRGNTQIGETVSVLMEVGMRDEHGKEVGVFDLKLQYKVTGIDTVNTIYKLALQSESVFDLNDLKIGITNIETSYYSALFQQWTTADAYQGN